MYLPKLTAAIPFIAILYFAKPDPSFVSRLFSMVGLETHGYSFNLVFIAAAFALSCIIDEMYRYGPNDLKKKVLEWYYSLGLPDDVDAPSSTGSSTSAAPTGANLSNSRLGR